MLSRAVAPLATLVLVAALAAALTTAAPGCGRSIFPFASATATSTGTPTPGQGSFVYTSNFADGTLSGYSRNATTGALTPFAAAIPAGAAKGPVGLAITPNNAFLYLANQGEGNVRGFSIGSGGALTGVASSVAGTNPMQVAIDPNGKFVFATSNGNGATGGQVFAYSIGTSGALTPQPPTSLLAPLGIAVDPSTAIGSNLVFVADNAKGVIYSFMYNTTTGALTQDGAPVNSLPTGPGSPQLLTTDNVGSFLYATDHTATTGLVETFAINPLTAPPLTLVNSVATGATQNMPTGVAFAATGQGSVLYTSNQGDNTVAVFSILGPKLTQIFTVTGFKTPLGIAVDPASAFLYVANNAANSLSLLSIFGSCGNALCPIAPAFATGTQPQFVAITH